MTLVAYHGTCDEIQEFNLDTIGQNTCNNAGAVFFSDDKEVAWNYSKEAFIRRYEDCEEVDQDTLEEQAEEQAHFYSVELDIRRPLELDIETINQDNERYCQLKGLYNVLDAHLLNHIINILQERRYEKWFDTYEESEDCKAMDYLLCNEITEHYDEERDEYIEHNTDFDCIIIKNAVDSINEDTNYIPSTIIAVLDPSIIRIKAREIEY